MKYLVAIAFVCLSLISCNKTESAVDTQAQLKADSLQAAVDSIAELRKLHSLTTGRHIHAPGSDLAEVAHQDLARKRRLLNRQKSIAESRKRATKAHALQLAKVFEDE